MDAEADLHLCCSYICILIHSGDKPYSCDIWETVHTVRKSESHTGIIIWETSWENLFMPHANNKGADHIYTWATSRENLSSGFLVSWDSKPVCSTKEACCSHEIAYIETRYIILPRQRTTKVLIRLCGYAGWSAPLLFAYGKNRFSHDEAYMYKEAHICAKVTSVSGSTGCHVLLLFLLEEGSDLWLWQSQEIFSLFFYAFPSAYFKYIFIYICKNLTIQILG